MKTTTKIAAKIKRWWRDKKTERAERIGTEQKELHARKFQIEELKGTLVITCDGVAIDYFKREATIEEVITKISQFRDISWLYEKLTNPK